MTDTNEGLLPCPFCGWAAHMRYDYGAFAECTNDQCDATGPKRLGPVGRDDDKREAADAWNRHEGRTGMSDDLVKRLGPILDRMDMTIEERAAHDAARIAELEADLKCVLDREAATYGRHGATITVLEDERDALAARVKELEGALARLVALNDDYSPFGGEIYRDRIARTWDIARAALARTKGWRGKNLACFCKPGTPCHADVLLEIANR